MTTASLAEPLVARTASRPALRDDLALAGWQVVADQRAFWRNRSRAFFSFALPLLFLVVFGALNRGDTLDDRGGIAANTFVVPGLLAYAVIMATFTNVANDLALMRETGVLKRLRGTPLPLWAVVAGRIGSAVITAAAVTVVTLAVGALAYGVDVRGATLPGLVCALALGTACFAMLGIAVLRLISTADSAGVVTNVAVLPLTFISGVWGDFGGMPPVLDAMAKAFPIQHLAHGLQVAFDPRTTGSGVVSSDLLALAAWTAAGGVLALHVLRREHARS
jgi:ABC-2 type transport system permease protein